MVACHVAHGMPSADLRPPSHRGWPHRLGSLLDGLQRCLGHLHGRSRPHSRRRGPASLDCGRSRLFQRSGSVHDTVHAATRSTHTINEDYLRNFTPTIFEELDFILKDMKILF